MNKANQTNGCGAMRGWLRWVRPPHHEFFREACELHDVLYEHGGAEADRKRADARLYEDMVRHSVEYFGGRGMVGSQAWFLLLSYGYYLAVRAFGRSAFNYH